MGTTDTVELKRRLLYVFLPPLLLSTSYKYRKPPILGVENTHQHNREGDTTFCELHRRLPEKSVWKSILVSSMKKMTYSSTVGDPKADWSRNSVTYGHTFRATDFGELHHRTLCNVNNERERENGRREGLSTAMWLCVSDLLTVGHNCRTTLKKPQSSARKKYVDFDLLC